MKTIIRGNNIEVTDSIKKYIEEKLSKMDKYFKDTDTEAKVVISVNGIDQKVEVTINESKYFIRAEEVHSDLYSAVDIVIDKLERQFRKYKTKFNNNKIKEVEFSAEIEDYFEEPEEDVVKRKTVFLKPMDEEEAITQMELLDHTFFVFKNIDTKKICVVYKRKDGAYGVLETN